MSQWKVKRTELLSKDCLPVVINATSRQKERVSVYRNAYLISKKHGGELIQSTPWQL